MAALLTIAAAPTATMAQNRQALMIGSYWVGWMNESQVVQAPLPNGPGAQLTVYTSYLSTPFLDLITTSVAGKVAPTNLQLATYSTTTGLPMSLLKITNARIQEIDLPAANAAQIMDAIAVVKFAPAIAEAAGKPTVFPPGNTRGQNLLSNNFRFQLDSIYSSPAASVASMRILLPDATKGVNLPQLMITYTESSANEPVLANAVQRWLTSQITQNGSLTFYLPDLKTPLLAVRFRGLRVLSNAVVSTMIKNGITHTTSAASFSMIGISVPGAVAP
jgi:hypothetical protein